MVAAIAITAQTRVAPAQSVQRAQQSEERFMADPDLLYAGTAKADITPSESDAVDLTGHPLKVIDR